MMENIVLVLAQSHLGLALISLAITVTHIALDLMDLRLQRRTVGAQLKPSTVIEERSRALSDAPPAEYELALN